MRDKRPTTVADGFRIDIDGTEVLLLRTPFDAMAADTAKAMIHQLRALNVPHALVGERPDGRYIFFVFGDQALQEKLEASNLSKIHWTKIPIYP